MDLKTGWRYPLTFSLAAHLLLLAAAGWSLARLPAAGEPRETVVEIQLAATPAESDGLYEAPAAAAPPAATPPNPDGAAPAAQPGEAAVAAAAAPAFLSGPAAAPPSAPAAVSGGPAAPSAAPGAPVRATAVRLLHRTDPVYPAVARKHGWQGVVTVRIEVLATGRTGSITVHRSSGHAALDKAAVDAVRQWRFAAATEAGAGLPVASIAEVNVGFNINN